MGGKGGNGGGGDRAEEVSGDLLRGGEGGEKEKVEGWRGKEEGGCG